MMCIMYSIFYVCVLSIILYCVYVLCLYMCVYLTPSLYAYLSFYTHIYRYITITLLGKRESFYILYLYTIPPYKHTHTAYYHTHTSYILRSIHTNHTLHYSPHICMYMYVYRAALVYGAKKWLLYPPRHQIMSNRQ